MTQKEIAKTLNITQATVSMALSGSTRISPALRETVVRLAADRGYQPNIAGQMLRKKRTNVIGAILPRLTNLFYAELFQEVQTRLIPHGYMLYFCPATNPEERTRAIATLRQMCVAGVIGSTSASRELLELRRAGIAVVLYGGNSRLGDVSQVLPDREAGAEALVRHLLERGRRRIAYFGGNSPLSGRYRAYRRVLAEAGLPELNIPFDSDSVPDPVTVTAILLDHLKRYPDIDAIFTHNDELAIAARRAIDIAGYSVPGDIALAGFDNIPSGAYMIPPLTTVEQPRGEIAEALIAELFAGLKDPSHNAFVSIPCKLVVREST